MNGAYGQKEWLHCLIGLCTVALFVFVRGPKRKRDWTAGSAATLVLTAALPVYILFQAAPLPSALVETLSPARAALSGLLAENGLPAKSYALSVHTAKTLEHGLRFLGFALLVLTIRELALRRPERNWVLVAPLVGVACLQAAAGLLQVQFGEEMARGGYANRNHFAGLLEMALPFAPAFAFATLERLRDPYSTPIRPALLASAGFLAAVLLLAGVLLSLSRAGFLIALLGLAQVLAFRFVAGAESRAFRLGTIALLGALAAGFVAAFLFLPSTALIERFADLAATEEVSAANRTAMWRETLDVVRDFWTVGCGLGGFRSAFVAYRASSPMHQISFAHNDFLQYLAELGVVGFSLGFVPIVFFWLRLVRRVRTDRRPNRRYLALGCLVSLHSLALHSLVDFNLYIPGNALAFSWVLGVGAALSQRDPATTKRPDFGAVAAQKTRSY